jgi:hypothetical protein
LGDLLSENNARTVSKPPAEHLYRDLEERETRIRRLVNANIIGICVWNLAGRIIQANHLSFTKKQPLIAAFSSRRGNLVPRGCDKLLHFGAHLIRHGDTLRRKIRVLNVELQRQTVGGRMARPEQSSTGGASAPLTQGATRFFC